MNDLAGPLIDAAAESFPMRGPVYEFGFLSVRGARPPGASGGPIAAEGGESSRVDRLEDLAELPFGDGEAGTVLCDGALEYAFEPHGAVAEMIRVLAPGGLLVVVVSSRAPATAGANRYWTPTAGAIERLLADLSATVVGWIGSDAAPHTVFGVGCKAPPGAEFVRGVQPFIARLERALAKAAREMGPWTSLRRWLAERLSPPRDRRAWREAYQSHYALHLPVDADSRPAILGGCVPPTKTGTRLDLSQEM